LIGPAVADQDGRQAPSGIDGARHGAFAEATLHAAGCIGIRKRELEAARPEAEVVCEDLDWRSVESLQCVPDWIVKTIADDCKISEGRCVADKRRKGRIDSHGTKKTLENGTFRGHKSELGRHALPGVDPPCDPFFFDPPPFRIGELLEKGVYRVCRSDGPIEIDYEEHGEGGRSDSVLLIYTIANTLRHL